MGIADRVREVSRWHLEAPLMRLLLRPDGTPVERISHCDLPVGAVAPGSICYCGGVGEEIEFERALAERFGAEVWAFDPTPRSVAFMERSDHDRTRLRFMPVGLWREDTTLRFHAPANAEHVSHSVMGAQGGEAHFDAPCRSLPSLMRELGHRRIDLLKLNIEGAEHEVLEAMLEANIRPPLIALTWEGRGASAKALRWTRRLRDEGWSLVGRRGWFFTYWLGRAATM